MKYGLKQQTIDKITDTFLLYTDIEKAILYGSRAKGNFKAGSDIDISLVGEHLNLEKTHSIENSLDDLMLPYSFDISIYNKIKNNELVQHIDRVGIELYKRK